MSTFELFGVVSMTAGPFAVLYVLDWMEKRRANADFAKRWPNARVNK
jgi:hypothetical protein